ncbi:MAG: HIT domain-containing protein [Calditrichaceae bacterium]|nr:HIT domain-containing protein [Calditrichaceae bacterium]
MKQLWAPWRMEYIQSEIDNTTEGCIFCDFPNQENDSRNLIVYRSAHCFVILNRFPYNNGHLMVVPYKHTSDVLQLSDEELLDLQLTINKSVRALRNVVHPHAMNIGMNLGRTAGAGIDEHVHYHIVPRWDGDTNYMPIIAGTKVVSESLQASFEKLTAEFDRLFK